MPILHLRIPGRSILHLRIPGRMPGLPGGVKRRCFDSGRECPQLFVGIWNGNSGNAAAGNAANKLFLNVDGKGKFAAAAFTSDATDKSKFSNDVDMSTGVTFLHANKDGYPDLPAAGDCHVEPRGQLRQPIWLSCSDRCQQFRPDADYTPRQFIRALVRVLCASRPQVCHELLHLQLHYSTA